ncbi:hypothetical protein LguiA_019056 [Lonicera macranthoides]
MGSLESGIPLKRDNYLPRSSSSSAKRQVPRSRLARLVLFNAKIDYLQWVCTVAVFLFFVVVFQMFLPGSVMEKSGNLLKETEVINEEDLMFLKEIGGLDFGEDIIKFEPLSLRDKFQKQSGEFNMTFGSRIGVRFDYRKPQLALVFADLLVDPQQIMMVTVAAALCEIGYEIEVYSIEDGPVHSVWRNIGVSVNIIQTRENKIIVDWLKYDGILVSSLEGREVISCLLKEPFKSVPLIWTIHDGTLATRLRQYISMAQIELLVDWKAVFNRATVVVFRNHVLPILYSACDAGNYFVIPGSPAEIWEADNFMSSPKENLHVNMDIGPHDFVIAIVGSQILYRGLWVEHSLVLQALLPLLADFPSASSRLKIIILSGDLTGNYSASVEAIALNLRYPSGTVRHIAVSEDEGGFINMADLVIYGSLLEERSFPEILIKAMGFGKPIIAPDLSIIRKYVDDRVNGYLFPKENIGILTQIVLHVVSKGKLSPLAHNVASIGKRTAKNLMALETIEGYALLLENVLKLPSEVASPRSVSDMPSNLKEQWQWHLFEANPNQTYFNRTLRRYGFLEKVERQWSNSHKLKESSSDVNLIDETFLYGIWEEERNIGLANKRKRREEEELKGRSDQSKGTWEEVYRSAKRADRSKNDLHERDDGELLRTGQPLCIYEPYIGEGVWPFLHRTSLYRGLGLLTKGRRHGVDDIDGPSRLPLLSNTYYRDVIGEHGAFFAIANRIDRIHRNAWIGFQSWRATARKESLSRTAESTLLDAIQARRHGDTLYFWARMDTDPRNPSNQLDFWSFCDSINAGNCKFAFSEALKKMYGIKQNWTSIPSMPIDGDTWSVMNSWVLPTRSFLEFVMFSRMFVDALDAQMYDEHRQSGHCYLSLSKDKHCYSRVLELLVNMWAYHSARRMVYINAKTGEMQEQHGLKSRRGQMWVKWFQFSTLKNMDSDLAEESDSDHPKNRWLWPLTGEVFWQGIYEKEKNQRNRDREKRRQMSKDKISRIRRRTRQKTLGKYVKPLPEEQADNQNSTVVARPPLDSSNAMAGILR